MWPRLLQGLVVVWGAGVGVFLLTASAREYRVVMEPEERLLGCGHTCQHPDTNTSFSLGEECTQWADNFTQVSISLRYISQRGVVQVCDCPGVGCHFFRYGPSTLAELLQLVNLFGIFWGVFFMEALGQVNTRLSLVRSLDTDL